MYLSILVLPLLGSTVSGLLGRKIGVTGSHIITTACLLLASVLASIAFYEVGICGSPVSIKLTSWIDSELLSVSWGFLFDSLTVSMLIPVLFVSTLVHLYSVSYFSEDPHNQRFFSYLSLFTFFMIVLVTGDNYLILFLGWEGIGVVSYLLINFWYTRIAANKSAILALTQNRVGDMLFSIGLFGMFWLFGNLDFATVFSISPYMNETAITIISLLLLGGACAKSAQLLLGNWLPASMEGLKKIIIWNHLLFSYLGVKHQDTLSSNTNNIISSTPKDILEIITGNLLGDGSLRKPLVNVSADAVIKSKANASYSMTMSVKGYNYLVYLQDRVYGKFSSIGAKIYPYPNIALPQRPFLFIFFR